MTKCGKFIDWKKYRLGRLQSQMRTEFSRSVLQSGEWTCKIHSVVMFPVSI